MPNKQILLAADYRAAGAINMPIIFISGINKNNILTINKKIPITTRQKINTAKAKKILNAVSI